MALAPAVERFVLHWGEMGTRWGVNRSVAQIHALLYLSTRPLTAEEISETLMLARSNVSTSIKELQFYRLINIVHVMGDRRDHFVAETDTWTMLLNIAEGRKSREIDPTVSMLQDCVAEAEADPDIDPVVAGRITAMLAFIEMLAGWYGQMHRLPVATLSRLVRLGRRVARMIGE